MQTCGVQHGSERVTCDALGGGQADGASIVACGAAAGGWRRIVESDAHG